MRISRLTTVERDNLTPSPSDGGWIIYNTTTDKYQVFNENTLAWANVIDETDIPIYIDETFTIPEFETGKTYYYVGNTAKTFDYDLEPYPTPIPNSGYNLVNKSVFNVTVNSDMGNSTYVLSYNQSLRDVQVFDNGGIWAAYPTEYFDNIYDLQKVTDKGAITTNALIVRNNPDIYRTRYSILGQDVQRDDLGFRVSYYENAITKSTNSNSKSWALQFPDLTANANSSSFTVAYRPNVSGTVAYLSDITNITEQTHTTGASVTINDGVDILYVDPISTIASLIITLPSTPINGQEVKISFGGTLTAGTVVTSLSVVGNVGHTVLGGAAITTAEAGDGYTFKFQTTSNLWRIF